MIISDASSHPRRLICAKACSLKWTVIRCVVVCFRVKSLLPEDPLIPFWGTDRLESP